MNIYNSLSRKIEKFEPLHPPQVGIYTCGPTVYDHMHIGNLRTFLLSDMLQRELVYNGYKILSVQNITDIDDKIIKRAKEKHILIEEIARKYTQLFTEDVGKLNINLASYKQPKATDYIAEIIHYIKSLIDRGFAYIEKDGSVYFDISQFPEYGKLSGIEIKELKQTERIRVDEYTKDDVQDFALWKATPDEKDEYVFPSPWSRGRPGWHIECSVMSQKLLGDTFDIHVGGVDLIFPHHENEIAQSEAKTGKPFVKYFVHGEHILVNGEKMSKSKGNFYTIDDVVKQGIEPLALRLLFLQTHYRQITNFTWEAAHAAQSAYTKLKEIVAELKDQTQRSQLSVEKLEKVDEFQQQFAQALSNDLQTPQAIAVMWEMLKFNIPSLDKLDLLYDFDKVFGLKLSEIQSKKEIIPDEVQKLADERQKAREAKDFKRSDELRQQIKNKGYIIEDIESGYQIKKH